MALMMIAGQQVLPPGFEAGCCSGNADTADNYHLPGDAANFARRSSRSALMPITVSP